jgi:uncharacterized membrane protein
MELPDNYHPAPRRSLLLAVFLAAALLFIGWLLSTPPGIFGKADAVGYAVCHRIEARSFHMFGRQLPLCARCSGMFLGALVGLFYQAILAPRRSDWPPLKIAVLLVLFLAGFGLDGINSFAHMVRGEVSVYEPQNWLRLVTGTGMGLAIAAAIYPAFNQTVWANVVNQAAIGSWKTFAGLLMSGILVVLLILSENPYILYPLALASAASVVLLLTLIYSLIWLIVWRQENRFQNWSQMVLPLAAGFFLAFLQIAAFNAVRFWLTGTWEGFVIG